MASGTITFNKSSLTSSKSYILGKIEYEYTQSTSANTSTITFNVYVKKDNDSTKLTETTNGTFKYELTINGESFSGSQRLEILTSYKQIGSSFTITVDHSNDGSKSLDIDGSVWLSSNSSSAYYNKKSSVDTTIALATIPRASSITSVTNVTLGNSCSVKWTPKASTFAYRLKFSCGNVSFSTNHITPKSTSAYTYNYAMTIEKWANALPNSYTGTCKVTLYTYMNSSSTDAIGSSTVGFTITLPKSVAPSISNFTTTLVNGWNGYYIQGKSQCKLSADFTAGTGSAINSCLISGTGLSQKGTGSSLSGITSVLTKSGTIIYKASVVDNREASAYLEKKIYVYPYAAPVLTTFTAERMPTGTQVEIKYDISYSDINSKNKPASLKIYNKLSGNETWNHTRTVDLSSASGTVILDNYETTSSYDFKAVAIDTYGSSSVEAMTSIPSEFRLINMQKNKDGTNGGVSIGKMSEEYIFDCSLPARFLDSIEFTSNNGNIYGSLEVDYNENGNNIVYIRNGQDVEGGASMALAIHRSSVYIPGDANDGLVNLGSGSRKWNQLYAKSDTISTSDRTIKTDITNMADTQEQLFNKLKPVTFKFTNGSSGRTHYGFISQDVEDSLSELSLTGQDFAGFCKDLRVDDNGEAILDENNRKIYDYALRYSEFIALNTYMIQKLQTENKELKAELQALKEMITNINASSNSAE